MPVNVSAVLETKFAKSLPFFTCRCDSRREYAIVMMATMACGDLTILTSAQSASCIANGNP
eukprot:25894-Eustigmatos_ZCMA.PRE.1